MKNCLILFIPLSLFLSACSTLSGTVANNHYLSASGDLSVELPSIPLVTARDGHDGTFQFAEFTSDQYWMMSQYYSVEWIPSPEKANKKLLMLISKLMKSGFEKDGSQLNTPVCEMTYVRGSLASRCTAKGVKNGIQAEYIGTSFVLKNHVVNAYVCYPLDQGQKPLNKYHSFINSIEIH